MLESCCELHSVYDIKPATSEICSDFSPVLGEHLMHDFAQTSRKMAKVLVLFLAHLIKTPDILYVDSH